MTFSRKQLHELSTLSIWVNTHFKRALEASNLSIQSAHEKLALKYLKEIAEYFGYELKEKQ